MSMKRWRRPCLALAGMAFFAARALADPTPADKIYAQLAKMPPKQREAKIIEGAKKEGALSFIQTLRGQVGHGETALFAKRYPFLKLDNTQDIGSQDAAQRMYSEEAAGRHLTDVISIARADMVNILKAGDEAIYPTPATSVIRKKYRRFIDPKNRWTPYYWSEYGISYNSNLVPPDKAPKHWMDLCNPFFKGAVSTEPANIRFLAAFYNLFGEQGTHKFLECLGKNKPVIMRGFSQRIDLMLAGDTKVQGENYLYYGAFLKKKNPSLPYAMVLTSRIIASSGIAVINKNTPHPYASALFVDWLLSDESQKWLAHEFRGPLTLHHPFLPDNVRLVDNKDPPPDAAKRILGWWYKYDEPAK